MTTFGTCLHCGEKLDSNRRSHAQFCDANCRKRYSRGRKSAEHQIDKIQSEVNQLYLILKRVKQSRTPEAMGKIKHIEAQLKDILRMYDRETMIDQAQLNDMLSRRGKV